MRTRGGAAAKERGLHDWLLLDRMIQAKGYSRVLGVALDLPQLQDAVSAQ